ncbi:hypothetical protein Y032_0027g1580 [Ancylostoma ceylanicum]|uniref:Uncharacterized protein n=1 Tax=Ancylostoma ceylanicum TaxID=53326 RepID=A0A016UUV1_9BILA|nr:hypothetical protein Y032_0027g1580 [Ancylostoma ceylanicum]
MQVKIALQRQSIVAQTGRCSDVAANDRRPRRKIGLHNRISAIFKFRPNITWDVDRRLSSQNQSPLKDSSVRVVLLPLAYVSQPQLERTQLQMQDGLKGSTAF